MHPTIHLNWLAIVVAVVASFAIGGVWYGLLFGKTWAKEMGFTEGWKPTGAEIARGMILSIVGALLMAYVLSFEVRIWRPSSWNLGADAAPAVYGFFAAFFAWLGFVVPILLNGVGYERKSWKLFGINAAHQFIAMLAMATILSFWR